MIAVGLSALIAIVAYTFTFRRSFMRLPELADARPMPRISPSISPIAFLHKRLWRSPSQRACCKFVARSLLRSTVHLQTLLCFLAVGLVVSAESLSSLSLHFFVESNTSPPVEFLSIPFILSYCLLVGMRFAFEIPLDLRANWIFRLWLDPDRHDSRSVARRVLLMFSLFCLGPLTFLCTLEFWGWTTALLHTTVWCACTVVLVEILLVRFRKVPFTCQYPPFQSHSPLIVVGYLFGFFIFQTWLPRLDQWSVYDPILAVWFVPLLGSVLGGLSWYRSQMLDMDKRLTFENVSTTIFL